METSILIPAVMEVVVIQGTAGMRVPFASEIPKDETKHYCNPKRTAMGKCMCLLSFESYFINTIAMSVILFSLGADS